MKIYFFSIVFTCLISAASAQQYAQFNTKTLFDSFENPAQSAFTLDSSRKYASNFLIPYLDFSSLNKGNSDAAINTLIRNGYDRSRTGKFANPEIMRENVNIYVFNLRIFNYNKNASEMGFSWQIKSDTEVNYDKGTSLGYFDTFSSFATLPRVNIFDNNFKAKVYHQFSYNYRENYTERLAVGARVSVLSGMAYTEFKANQSTVSIDQETDRMDVILQGINRFNYPGDDSFSPADVLPFKNLGASVSLGTTYLTRSGIFLMGNIKDLGFIRWNKKSKQATFYENTTFDDIVDQPTLRTAMENIGRDQRVAKAFVTPINSRADFLISKTFGVYTPSLILTKNIFDKFGEVALVNTVKVGVISISATPSYNLDDRFRVGMQGMIKSPNLEMFLGTNDLMQTYYASKDIIKNDDRPTGYNRGSVYLGMAFKIGSVVEHPMNLSKMPKPGEYDEKKNFFGKIFDLFRSK